MLKEKPLLSESSEKNTTEHLLPRPPILSNSEASWNGVFWEYHSQPPSELSEGYNPKHGIIVSTDTPTSSVELTLDGYFRRDTVAQGDILIIPANISHEARWHKQAEFIHIGIETMANALAVHLLQHYCTRKTVLPDCTGGLPQLKLRQAIDYINSHLERDLSLVELAAIVHMSPHYRVIAK